MSSNEKQQHLLLIQLQKEFIIYQISNTGKESYEFREIATISPPKSNEILQATITEDYVAYTTKSSKNNSIVLTFYNFRMKDGKTRNVLYPLGKNIIYQLNSH